MRVLACNYCYSFKKKEYVLKKNFGGDGVRPLSVYWNVKMDSNFLPTVARAALALHWLLQIIE